MKQQHVTDSVIEAPFLTDKYQSHDTRTDECGQWRPPTDSSLYCCVASLTSALEVHIPDLLPAP